jgi:hypothetical protein
VLNLRHSLSTGFGALGFAALRAAHYDSDRQRVFGTRRPSSRAQPAHKRFYTLFGVTWFGTRHPAN